MEEPALSVSVLLGGWGGERSLGKGWQVLQKLWLQLRGPASSHKPTAFSVCVAQLPSLTTSPSLTCFPKWASNLRAGFRHPLFQKGIYLPLAEDEARWLSFQTSLTVFCFRPGLLLFSPKSKIDLEKPCQILYTTVRTVVTVGFGARWDDFRIWFLTTLNFLL